MMWRIMGRVVERIIGFAVIGALLMTFVHGLEGLLLSLLFGHWAQVITTPNSTNLGQIADSFLGWPVVGALLGAFAYLLAGVVTSTRNDVRDVLASVSRCSIISHFLCVLLGVMNGAWMFPLWVLVVAPYLTKVPPRGGTVGEEIFFGCYLGVILGATIGTVAGALYGALAKKFQPAATVPSTRSGLGAPS